MTVLAHDPQRRTNAELMLDCAALGYLDTRFRVLDPTYGLGNWWKLWCPWEGRLHRHDLDPAKAPDGPMDFTALAYPARSFDVVAFDPPYKLNGTPTPAVDAAYGVHEAASPRDRLDLMLEGLSEAARVTRTGGFVLMKCQDQVVSGRKVFQTLLMANHGQKEANLRLLDMLHVSSYRPQPRGRRQVHSAGNYSSLLVFRKLS
jgi:hypothetical protein